MNNLSGIDLIKKKIETMYKINPNIHISTVKSGAKPNLQDAPAIIKGVYPHIFRIEENSSGFPKCRCIQYVDVLINQVEIPELKDIQ